MNEWLITNKELISIYSSVFQTIGAILVPVALAIWGVCSEKHKTEREQARIERDKIEQIKKEEKNVIVSFIKEYIYPLDDKLDKICWDFGTELKKLKSEFENTNDNDAKVIISKNIEISENNHKAVLVTILQKCERSSINLINLISYFQYYNYIVPYLDMLLLINYKIRDNIDNISKSDLISGIIITINNIRATSYRIELYKEIYEESMTGYFYSYCKYSSTLKNITLEVLKDYPKYYDIVQNHITEQEVILQDKKTP